MTDIEFQGWPSGFPATPYEYVKRIVLEANADSSRPPTFTIARDDWGDVYAPVHLDGPLGIISCGSQRTTISDIDLSQWTVRFETDHRDDFKKVASVVGKDKAAEVLSALRRPAPEDWDKERGTE